MAPHKRHALDIDNDTESTLNPNASIFFQPNYRCDYAYTSPAPPPVEKIPPPPAKWMPGDSIRTFRALQLPHHWAGDPRYSFSPVIERPTVKYHDITDAYLLWG